jgi:hypothetical protein
MSLLNPEGPPPIPKFIPHERPCNSCGKTFFKEDPGVIVCNSCSSLHRRGKTPKRSHGNSGNIRRGYSVQGKGAD